MGVLATASSSSARNPSASDKPNPKVGPLISAPNASRGSRRTRSASLNL